jgi:hypothetical protein
MAVHTAQRDDMPPQSEVLQAASAQSENVPPMPGVSHKGREIGGKNSGSRDEIGGKRIAAKPGRPKGRVAGHNFRATGWRIEVKARGKYFQYRKGSGKERISRYGGKFSELARKNPERAAAYYQNQTNHARTMARNTGPSPVRSRERERATGRR